jgi:UDP-glucuronate decarboxylase
MKMEQFIEGELKDLAKKVGPLAGRLTGKTVLINGAGGFLGNYFVGFLQHLNKTKCKKKPIKIIALDNFITGVKNSPFFDLEDPNLDFIGHDVRVPFETNKNIDYIIHAAGIASPVFYAKYPMETIAATVDGIKNTLELARFKKPKGILYFSSSEIYGDPHPEAIPTPERYRGHVSSTGLRACYDESKRLGETIATIYHRMYEVPVMIIRPFNVYGPGMKIDDQRVLPNFLNAALDGRTIEIHNRGEQTRTFSYATDAVNGFFRALFLGRPGEAYNIGTDFEEISMYDLAKKVEKAHDTSLDIRLAEYPKGYPVGDPNRRAPDLTKARKELSYKPVVTLDDGLRRMFTWYKLLRGETPHKKTSSKKSSKRN